MRNGNKEEQIRSPFFRIVLILPMRNGNIIMSLIIHHREMFLSYLWGMETLQLINSASEYNKFLSYLWGMETLCKLILLVHGNYSSYPTYEEWKRTIWGCVIMDISFLSYLWGMETIQYRYNFDNSSTFLSYLWGMETKKTWQYFILYKNWFLSYLWGMETIPTYTIAQILWLVLILPMRNGNIFIFSLSSVNTYTFLSYLWGMETLISIKLPCIYTKFLSYLWGMETLKKLKKMMRQRKSSYPTYEEWKLFKRFVPNLDCFNSSYPTYEEWKLGWFTILTVVCVLPFLSYLWGMETL